MVGTDSTASNTSERQFMIGKLPKSIVHAPSTETNLFQPFLFYPGILSKNIESQWISIGFDKVQCFVHCIKTENGQYRSKNFLCHYRRVRRQILHNCGSYKQLLPVGLSAENDFPMRKIGDQFIKPSFIDNPAITTAFRRVFTKKCF